MSAGAYNNEIQQKPIHNIFDIYQAFQGVAMKKVLVVALEKTVGALFLVVASPFIIAVWIMTKLSRFWRKAESDTLFDGKPKDHDKNRWRSE